MQRILSAVSGSVWAPAPRPPPASAPAHAPASASAAPFGHSETPAMNVSAVPFSASRSDSDALGPPPSRTRECAVRLRAGRPPIVPSRSPAAVKRRRGPDRRPDRIGP